MVGTLFIADERRSLLVAEPDAFEYLGRLVGGQELIRGVLRYALVIPDSKLGGG